MWEAFSGHFTNMDGKTIQRVKGQKASPMHRKEVLSALCFITPLVIGIGVFYFYAFYKNLYYSFTDLGVFGEPNFIGLKNYKTLLSDERFFRGLLNTLKYVLVAVPGIVGLAVISAVVLNGKIKGATFFRTLLFIPAVTLPSAISLLWRWLYNGEYGIFNVILTKGLGLPAVGWLTDTNLSLYSIAAVMIWSMTSTQMILVLAGLKGIPGVYYEAAEIDGAGKFQMFRHITLPLLSPTLFFVVVVTIINVFQTFDYIFMMLTKEALTMQYSMSLVYYFYRKAFIEFDRGYAATVSMALFVIVITITVLQMRLQKKWVHYD